MYRKKLKNREFGKFFLHSMQNILSSFLLWERRR